MIVTTVTFKITGKSYEDILLQAKKRLSVFFDMKVEEVSSNINFDVVIKEYELANEFDDEDDEYEAEIIAKVKDHV